jgi:hypothetical protein
MANTKIVALWPTNLPLLSKMGKFFVIYPTMAKKKKALLISLEKLQMDGLSESFFSVFYQSFFMLCIPTT